MKPGFVVFLYDKLTADGMETIVVPPTPIPVESGIEVKTDRGDSRKHAHLLERDTLKKVHVNFGWRLVFPDHAGPHKPLGPVLARPPDGSQSYIYSVVLPSKCSLSASASARVWWTTPSR